MKEGGRRLLFVVVVVVVVMLGVVNRGVASPGLETSDGNVLIRVDEGKTLYLRRMYPSSSNTHVDDVVATQADLSPLTAQMTSVSELVGELSAETSSTTHALESTTASLELTIQNRATTLAELFTTGIDNLEAEVEADLALKADRTELDTSVDSLSTAINTARDSLSGAISLQMASLPTSAHVDNMIDDLSVAVANSLESRFLAKADASRVTTLEQLVTRTWPALEDFTNTPQGWIKNGAAFSAVTNCGPLGTFLGGFSHTAQDNLEKTFQLPVHQGVRIELEYAFIDSWDGENGLIYVDDVLVWSRIGRLGMGPRYNYCGNNQAHHTEDVAFVVIDLPNHTGASLHLRVTSSLDQASTDESFGVANVRIGPLLPRWPPMETFVFSELSGWQGGSAVGISLCGVFGNVLGGPEKAGQNAQLRKTFTLPSHNGLRLQLRVVYFDTWDNVAKVVVTVDGALVWSGARPASSLGDVCGSSLPEAATSVDVTVPMHTSPHATLVVTSTLNVDATIGSFGISDVYLSPLVPSWPATIDFEDPSDAILWGGTFASIFQCGVYGNVFGGPQHLGGGHFITRTFVNLPNHEGLQISFTYLFIDTWDVNEVGIVYADGERLATLDYSVVPSATICGTAGAVDRVRDYVFTLPRHTAPTLTLRFTSNLNSAPVDESFAVDNIVVTTITPSWPKLDTFTNSDDGWATNGGAAVGQTVCGLWGSMLGGYNILGQGSFVTKTYYALPVHHALHIQLDAFFIDSWDSEVFRVWVDNQLVWSQVSTNNKAGAVCGSDAAGYFERREPVDVVIPHTKDSVTIRVDTTLDSAPNDESFAIDNVLVGPASILGWPTVDNFEIDANNWSGNNGRSSCGQFGNMLGGYGVAGQNAVFTKTFGPLPPHSGLQIQLTFYFIDSWDGDESGFIEVDGVLRWTHSKTNAPGVVNLPQLCGHGHAESHVFVNLAIANHFNEYVTIRIYNTLNQAATDESMAIDDVRILPL